MGESRVTRTITYQRGTDREHHTPHTAEHTTLMRSRLERARIYSDRTFGRSRHHLNAGGILISGDFARQISITTDTLSE